MSSNCSNCVFKANISGDCHISCTHPDIKAKSVEIMLGLISHGGEALKPLLGFSVDNHAIENDWFNFPVNFDPTWMNGTCKLIKVKNI